MDFAKYSQLLATASNEVGAHLQRAFKNSKKPPSVLYHYTDAAGFLGIIQTGSLWASDVRFMNDTKEMKFPMDLLRQLAEEKATVNHLKELVGLVEHMSTFMDFGFRAYAVSFSELSDDLNQWRAYAGGVGGYSIGFDLRTEKFSSLITGSDFGDIDILVPLNYNSKSQITLLSQLQFFQTTLTTFYPAY